MRPIVWAVAAAFLAAAAPSSAQTATGALVLNGSSTPLRYAYAAARPGFFDKTKEDVQILLSDVPLSEPDRADVFALARLGREGRAHIVEVLLDADASPIAGAFYAPVFDGVLSATGMHVFERTRFDVDVVEGRLGTRAQHAFDGITIAYHATFVARIPRPPTPEQLAAALASPPGQVARLHLRALLAGDLPAFRQTLNPAAADAYEGAAGRDRLMAYRREMPGDAVVTAVTQSSDAVATATVQGHEGGTLIEYSLSLERRDGGWRVGR